MDGVNDTDGDAVGLLFLLLLGCFRDGSIVDGANDADGDAIVDGTNDIEGDVVVAIFDGAYDTEGDAVGLLFLLLSSGSRPCLPATDITNINTNNTRERKISLINILINYTF